MALFSNEELRLLADTFSIWETLELRRLGLLGPDEGYDGTQTPKASTASEGGANRDFFCHSAGP